MSRTHLYRGGRSSRRPLFSVIVGSAWCGAALAAIVAAMPQVANVAPSGGAVADERFAFVRHDGRFLEDSRAAAFRPNEIERARANNGRDPRGDAAATRVEARGGSPDLRERVGHDFLGISRLADDGRCE